MPDTLASARVGGPSFFDIIRRREALGAGLGHFCCNYVFYFVLSWLPLYLVQERGFTIARMAALGGGVYLMQGVGAWATGWVHDRANRRGITPNRMYKTTFVVSLLVSGAGLVGVVLAGPLVSAACLLVTGLSGGLGSSSLYASAQTLAGPSAAGRWVGFQNFVGNLAGVGGPAITGFLVDRSGHFYTAFALAIAMALIGVLSWSIIIPSIEPLDWARAPTGPLVAVPVET